MLERGLDKCIRECIRRGLISLRASEEIDAISGPWQELRVTRLYCEPLWHQHLLQSWSKILVEKTGRGQYFCGPLWPPDCPVLKSVFPHQQQQQQCRGGSVFQCGRHSATAHGGRLKESGVYGDNKWFKFPTEFGQIENKQLVAF